MGKTDPRGLEGGPGGWVGRGCVIYLFSFFLAFYLSCIKTKVRQDRTGLIWRRRQAAKGVGVWNMVSCLGFECVLV
jgi:hypothetical protein